jgi:hypothetical protein
MLTDSTAAFAASSTITIIPSSPVCALDAIYRIAERDMTALQEMSTRANGDVEKSRFEEEEARRWAAVRAIPAAILYERPQNASDVRALLHWLAAALERIEGAVERGTELANDAKAALVAAENLNTVVPPMLHLESMDDFGAIRRSFDRRYFSAQAER